VVLKHIAWTMVEIVAKELCTLFAIETTQQAGPVTDEIGLPVLHVGRVGAWCEQLKLEHIAAAEQATIGTSQVPGAKGPKGADGPHPAKASHGIRVWGEPSSTDAAPHLGHCQEQQLMSGHDFLRD
jgi:hypothetical protein